MVLHGLATQIKDIDEMLEIQHLFDKFQKKHKRADRSTFLALLEIFCREGFVLEQMKHAIELEIKCGDSDG